MRAEDIRVRIGEIKGRSGGTGSPLGELLDLLAEFPPELLAFVDAECKRNPNPEDRIPILRPLLIHSTYVRDFVDSWLGSAELQEVPLSLVAGMKRVCDSLGLVERKPIVSIGPATNFNTVVADVENIIFEKVGGVPPRVSQNAPKFAIVRVPHFEGLNVLWHPILLGHELGHLAVNHFDALNVFDLISKFDFNQAAQVQGVPGAPMGIPAAMRLLEIARNWAVELLCDAFAIRAFGLAGLSSLGEFLEAIGATDHPTETHPPGRLRIRLMSEWLTPVQDPRIEAVADPWRLLAAEPVVYPTTPWAQFLVDLFLQHGASVKATVDVWPADNYDTSMRSGAILAATEALTLGAPPDITVDVAGKRTLVAPADVICACWLCRVEEVELPFTKLGRKALDSLEFLQRWGEAGGSWPVPQGPYGEADLAQEAPVLSESDLRRRVYLTGTRRLIVTPLLPNFATGAAIDLRLGNQFIVFTRTRTASFDPLRAEDDPRLMQRFIELSWGATFILHPGELVLASTLEYLVLPDDLTAQVVTRSSYGRLGMLSATAVQVHPHFHGCLTLELVNLGTIPLVLTPGERIAQLVLSRTGAVAAPSKEKYRYPTGPEFSKVQSDPELQTLRELR